VGRRVPVLRATGTCESCGTALPVKFPAGERLRWRGVEPDRVVMWVNCRNRSCRTDIAITASAFQHATAKVAA
jgi:hypothetical protein